MKGIVRVALLLFVAVSCSHGTGIGDDACDVPGSSDVAHDMILLGEKLDDPYTVENVEAALKSVYPVKAARTDISATDIYVRFLPKNEEEYEYLLNYGLELMDHPMDYRIIKEGDYYHDPEIQEDEITWQYAVVDKNFKFPERIRYEILDHCYISENDAATRSDGIDWNTVERESYRLTGNEDMLAVDTKGSRVHPSGRITIVDEKANGGKPVGVSGVRVMCNAFVKFSSAYTNRDGYYKIHKSYSSKVRYRLVFKNEKGFAIGFNKILIPASTSTLGKSHPEGKSVEITKNSERKLFCRSAINNIVYDYFETCNEDNMDMTPPPSNLRIWIFQNLHVSSAIMMHHGAILNNTLISSFLGPYKKLIKIFMPDITIGVKGCDDYSSLYSLTCHELAHASHYYRVNSSYWNTYIKYIISSYIADGKMDYGNGDGEGSGNCEVSEMWAYFMESKLFALRYGGDIPSLGTAYWFYPQILRYLNERCLTCSDIIKALDPSVNSRATLKDKLDELYPDKKNMIDQAFNRYND
jgi:hypothetical protein